MGNAVGCFSHHDSCDTIRRESVMESARRGHDSVSVAADGTSTETVDETLQRIEAEREKESDVDSLNSDRSDVDVPQVRGCRRSGWQKEKETSTLAEVCGSCRVASRVLTICALVLSLCVCVHM